MSPSKYIYKSYEKEMNRNWNIKKAIPALKTKKVGSNKTLCYSKTKSNSKVSCFASAFFQADRLLCFSENKDRSLRPTFLM